MLLRLLGIEGVGQGLDSSAHGGGGGVGDPHGDAHRRLILRRQDVPVLIRIQILIHICGFRAGILLTGLGVGLVVPFSLVHRVIAAVVCRCIVVAAAGRQGQHHRQDQQQGQPFVDSLHNLFSFSLCLFDFDLSIPYHCCFDLAAGKDVHQQDRR